MLKSFQEVFTFLAVADARLVRDTTASKFNYALGRVLKRGVKLQAEYQERVEDINIDNCATDKDGVILRDDKGGFRFTKEGEKARNKARGELFRSSVEIEPHHCAELPDDLTDSEREVFAGFVIKDTVIAAEA